MGNVKGWYFAESWLCWSWCRILGEWLGITVRIYSLDPDWLRGGGGRRWFTVGLISKFNDINGTKNTQRYLFLFINNSCTSPWFLSSCFTQKFSFRISMLNRLWREKFLNLKPTLQNEMTGQEERQTTQCLLFVILVQQCICDQNHAGNVDAFIEDHCVDIIEIILKSFAWQQCCCVHRNSVLPRV